MFSLENGTCHFIHISQEETGKLTSSWCCCRPKIKVILRILFAYMSKFCGFIFFIFFFFCFAFTRSLILLLAGYRSDDQRWRLTFVTKFLLSVTLTWNCCCWRMDTDYITSFSLKKFARTSAMAPLIILILKPNQITVIYHSCIYQIFDKHYREISVSSKMEQIWQI